MASAPSFDDFFAHAAAHAQPSFDDFFAAAAAAPAPASAEPPLIALGPSRVLVGGHPLVGVFVQRDVPRGFNLGQYAGNTSRLAQVRARYHDQGAIPDRVLQLTRNRFIDGSVGGDWTSEIVGQLHQRRTAAQRSLYHARQH